MPGCRAIAVVPTGDAEAIAEAGGAAADNEIAESGLGRERGFELVRLFSKLGTDVLKLGHDRRIGASLGGIVDAVRLRFEKGNHVFHRSPCWFPRDNTETRRVLLQWAH